MHQKKKKHIVISLGIILAWVCIMIISSALSWKDNNIISIGYVWARLSGLLAGLGGLIFLALRLYNVVNRNENFGYAFFSIANLVIGLAGVVFYSIRRINQVGLHALLPNLFIGVVMMTDLFLYDHIFNGKTPE
jgi:hypothetical protein